MSEIRKIQELGWDYFVDAAGHHYEISRGNPNYVDFGSVSRGRLYQQSQYGSRFIDGLLPEYPNLGEGLRYDGSSYDYHELALHPDDIEEFVARVEAFRASAYGWKFEMDDAGRPHQVLVAGGEAEAARDFLRERKLPTQ